MTLIGQTDTFSESVLDTTSRHLLVELRPIRAFNERYESDGSQVLHALRVRASCVWNHIEDRWLESPHGRVARFGPKVSDQLRSLK